MKRVMTAIAFATVAAGGIAYAQQAGWGADITRADAQTRAAAMFDKLDINKDGKLDAADRAAHVQQMFDRMDTDHNGQLSREEFAAAHQHGPDGPGGPEHDGMAPPPEGGPDGGMGPGKMGHGMGMGHRGGPGGGMMAMAHMADTNNDGAISKDEFIAAALKRFDAADTNHDGKVTAAERQAAHKAMPEKWRAMRGGPDAPPPPPSAG